MDEWVTLSGIDVSKGIVEETPKERDYLESVNGRERKVTRNLKRKHDEINHVQKVQGGTEEWEGQWEGEVTGRFRRGRLE